jgi:hypothetical protein
MFDPLFKIDRNLLVVNRMLDGVAKEHPEYGAALIYNKLRPEHTFQLLDLPLGITFDLAALAGGSLIVDLAKQIWNAESNDNLNELAEAANRLNHYLLMATSPLVPERDSIQIEDLALCLTNYIMLRHALYRYLTEGEREATIPWSDTIRWSELPRESRLSYFLSMRWPAMVMMYMSNYLARIASELSTAGDEALETLPYPVYPIVPEAQDETSDNVLGQAVALHRKNQDYYRLWLRFFTNGEKDFYFESLWSNEEPFLETLVNILADIELEARAMSSQFTMAWKNFAGTAPAGPQYDAPSGTGLHLDLGSRDDLFLKYRKFLPSIVINRQGNLRQ